MKIIRNQYFKYDGIIFVDEKIDEYFEELDLIKKKKLKYLLKSKIYIYNQYIFKLAKYIFYLEKPIAPIELILINSDNTQSIQNFYP